MKKQYSNKIKSEKSNMVNIIIYSVILGVLVNSVSDSIKDLFGYSAKVRIIIGIILIIILIMVLLLYNIKRLSTKIKFDCAFIQDDKKSLISIPEYKISEKMKQYLDASFAENKAIKQQWLNSEFMFHKTNIKATKLVKELIEYTLLENFSIFISDYFNLLDENDKTFEMNRNDIPDIILKNRFLNMISEDISNRSAFIDITDNNNLVYTEKNGAIFHKFTLTLPIGSKLYSKGDLIFIDTKLFKISFNIIFEGVNTYIDYDLLEYYAHQKTPLDLSCYSFKVVMNVKYKLSSAFKFFDWKYYNWLDEYILRLQHFCDIDCFYNDINWKSIKALLEIRNNTKNTQ